MSNLVYANTTIARTESVDMNRDNSYGTLWRAKLSELMEQRPEWIIDVHSFPVGYLPSPINILVLSDTDSIPDGTVRASDDNSIIREAQRKRINAVLLEFEESERGIESARTFSLDGLI